MKTKLWVSVLVVALLIGAVVAGSLRHVAAQGAQRLTVVDAGSRNLVFISDARSGGCWLGIVAGSDRRLERVVGIAAAPAGACK
jgi:hypothetical protein